MTTIKQVLWQYGVPGISGRVYPPEVMKKAVEKYQEDIKANRALGTAGVPEDGKIRLDKVSHAIKSLEIKDGKLVGEFEVLDTPLGKVLSESIKNKMMTFSLGGIGSTTRVNGVEVVLDDYSIINIFCSPYTGERDVIIRC